MVLRRGSGSTPSQGNAYLELTDSAIQEPSHRIRFAKCAGHDRYIWTYPHPHISRHRLGANRSHQGFQVAVLGNTFKLLLYEAQLLTNLQVDDHFLIVLLD